MQYSEVIGQEDIKQRFRQLVAADRVPQGILLCGPQGCGKMALALALASHLLCEDHTGGDSCGHCRQCAMLRKWEHPDLHFTFPTVKPAGASSDRQPVSDDYMRQWHEMILRSPYITLNEWMECMHAANQQAIITAAESDALGRKLSLKASQDGYKVSIIWQPERMNGASANKLLKLLEEPPAHTVFIMVSEAPEQLLDTVRSRVQRIDVKKIDETSIARALVERRAIDEDTAARLARLANGSWNKAVEELDAGNENRLFLELFIQLMRIAYLRNIKDLRKWSETVAAFGREKQKRMLEYFMRMVRENFMYNFHTPQLCYMTKDEEDFSRNFARFINESNVIGITDTLDKARRDIAQNANGKIVFFDLSLRMIMLLLQK